jgi:hypothetical protein
MKELTTREIATIKRQFKNSLPALQKIESINKKIESLQNELKIQEAILEGGETGIKVLTGGYRSVDLIDCKYEPQFNEDGSPKMDKDGKYQLKKQVLTFKYPVEAESLEDNAVLDETPNAEVETPAAEAAFNPIDNYTL